MNTEWKAAAYHMIQSGYSSIAVKAAMYDEVEQDWKRNMSEDEIAQGIEAINAIVESI